jgi:DNA-binding transcriptional ArsR family regulator
VELDLLFKALADPTRRRLIDELSERNGQTLFELHARLAMWHDTAISRQALSKHLAALEDAGLIRIEWQWRSKFHFLEREPLRRMWRIWLGPLTGNETEGESYENRHDEPAGR